MLQLRKEVLKRQQQEQQESGKNMKTHMTSGCRRTHWRTLKLSNVHCSVALSACCKDYSMSIHEGSGSGFISIPDSDKLQGRSEFLL